MRNLVELPTITNVAANSHCVLLLPPGLTYDQIQFAVTNVTAAQMTNFKLRIGTNTIIDVSSFQVLEDQNTFYKRNTQSGFLTLWFYRPEFAEDARALTSLGTADLAGQPITIEFDLGVVTSPAIKAYAVQRPPSVSGLLTKIKEFTYTFSSAGKMNIADIPKAARINAIHLQKSDITDVDLQVNAGNGAVSVFAGSKALTETLYKQHNRTPVTASYTHLDLNLLGDISGPMPTQNLADMRIFPTIGTSGTVKVIVEYMDGLGGI